MLKICVLLATLAMSLGLASAARADTDPDIVCDPTGGKPCVATSTGIYLRLLVKPGATIRVDKDPASASAISGDLTPFSVLWAFDASGVSYDANFTATGWYQVGRDSKSAEGYIDANDVVVWKQALALAYTNPGPAERRPVLMFGSQQDLDTTLTNIQSTTTTPDQIYSDIDAGNTPDGIVSREGTTWVDITKTFYLLPILNYEKLDPVEPDMLGIQLAALTNQGQAQQSTACNLQDPNANQCLQQQSGGAPTNLALDVVFVVDTTNSMQPNIDAVTNSINQAAQTFAQKLSGQSLKFGIVGYRDAIEASPDLEYLTKNFTPDLLDAAAFSDLMKSGDVKSADAGSGDWAEDVFAGMKDGLGSNWSPNAAHIVVLIGDASGHPVGDPKNTTGLSEVAIKDLAAQQKAYVTAVYIDSNVGDDLTLARPQFEGMATGSGEGGAAAFSIVKVGGGGGEGNTSLEQSLQTFFENLVDFLATGKFSSVMSTSVDPNDTTAQALMSAVRAAFVDYLGKDSKPPGNITAWVLDRDLSDYGKHAFDVKVMLDKGQVEELQDVLSGVLSVFQGGQSNSSSFFSSVQTSATSTSYDLKISDAQTISDSSVVPAWIKAIPYKSEVMAMSVEEFKSEAADTRNAFEARLDKLIAYYKDILTRPDDWIRLNENGSPDDDVYMVDLADLP